MHECQPNTQRVYQSSGRFLFGHEKDICFSFSVNAQASAGFLLRSECVDLPSKDYRQTHWNKKFCCSHLYLFSANSSTAQLHIPWQQHSTHHFSISRETKTQDSPSEDDLVRRSFSDERSAAPEPKTISRTTQTPLKIFSQFPSPRNLKSCNNKRHHRALLVFKVVFRSSSWCMLARKEIRKLHLRK